MRARSQPCRRRGQRAGVCSSSSFSYDHQMCAAVLGPRALIVSRVERPFLAVADGAYPVSVDAQRHEVFLGGVRATITEGEGVLLRSTLVAMTFDEQVVLRILL